MTTRTKGPLIAHDAMSPRKKAASLPKPALGNASNLEDITLERNFLLSLLQQVSHYLSLAVVAN